MAHKGRYYESAFRRDLMVIQENIQYPWPKYFIWVQDGLHGGDATTANRWGKVSDAATNPNKAGIIEWHWQFRGIIVPYDCYLQMRLVDHRGNYELNFHMVHSFPVWTADIFYSSPFINSGYRFSAGELNLPDGAQITMSNPFAWPWRESTAFEPYHGIRLRAKFYR